MENFITYCLDRNIISFKETTLKSGRKSPYFFNSGAFHDGESFSFLVDCYTDLLEPHRNTFDMLFGPAYKGISLVSAICANLYRRHSVRVPFCYDRKETKLHGEGGAMVGATLTGRVLIVDDVLTAGTTIKQHISLLNSMATAQVVGVAIAFDRMERLDRSVIAATHLYHC